MDPDTTWEKMIDAMNTAHWDTAHAAASALRQWAGSGGFLPTAWGDDDRNAFDMAMEAVALTADLMQDW